LGVAVFKNALSPLTLVFGATLAPVRGAGGSGGGAGVELVVVVVGGGGFGARGFGVTAG
jgi:hypothetical protein